MDHQNHNPIATCDRHAQLTVDRLNKRRRRPSFMPNSNLNQFLLNFNNPIQ